MRRDRDASYFNTQTHIDARLLLLHRAAAFSLVWSFDTRLQLPLAAHTSLAFSLCLTDCAGDPYRSPSHPNGHDLINTYAHGPTIMLHENAMGDKPFRPSTIRDRWWHDKLIDLNFFCLLFLWPTILTRWSRVRPYRLSTWYNFFSAVVDKPLNFRQPISSTNDLFCRVSIAFFRSFFEDTKNASA